MSARFEDVLTKALQLSPKERLAILEEMAASLKHEFSADEADLEGSSKLTTEEITELMRIEPRSPAEIMTEGLLGTWSGLTITDGADWVNEQKRKRKERRKWQAP